MENKKIRPYIFQAVEAHLPAAVALSDDLYAHPELPDQEFESSRKMVELLRAAGFQVEYPFLCPTGFRALLDLGEGPSVAIMAEYDALPDLGHACGHNVHGAMSVLAGLALGDLRDRFSGRLYVIGTPAEEDEGKKVLMSDRGVFDGMDLAIMIHSNDGGINIPNMDVLSLENFIIEFTGQSSHAAAAPWNAHSALAAARKFLDLIDARRECFTPDIRVNGIITEGGQQPNIIPDRAVVRLEYRTDSQQRLRQVDDMVHKCAAGAAMALDCEVTFTKGFDGFADMVRVPALEREMGELMEELGREIDPVAFPSGSSDVGNVSYRCPTLQGLLAICDQVYGLHTVEFREATVLPPAHKAIEEGAAIIAALCLRVLTDGDFRQKVRTSYEKARARKLGE